MWLKTYKINNDYVKGFSLTIFGKILISTHYHKDGGWVRLFNLGISWTKTPSFAIRNGYKKFLKIKNTYYTIL